MKKIYCVLLLFALLGMGGCKTNTVQNEEPKKQSIEVPEKAYRQAGEKLPIIEDNEGDNEETVFKVQNKNDLIQVIQYSLDNGNNEVTYRSDADTKIDFEEISRLLSCLNPYDISLSVETTEYSGKDGNTLYTSNRIIVENLDKRYKEATTAAEKIYKEIIAEDMSNDEKIQAIHDYLVRNIVFNVVAEQDPTLTSAFLAAGALVDKNAVCTGYSRAFMMIAKLASVPALLVGSDTINHGWNLVYGDSGWRFIDVTWDDPVPDQFDQVEYKFLNMTIEEFMAEGSHKFDANRSKDSYLELADLIFK